MLISSFDQYIHAILLFGQVLRLIHVYIPFHDLYVFNAGFNNILGLLFHVTVTNHQLDFNNILVFDNIAPLLHVKLLNEIVV
jgi:hypothetical protein